MMLLLMLVLIVGRSHLRLSVDIGSVINQLFDNF